MVTIVRQGVRPLAVLAVLIGVLGGCWPSVGTDFADPGPYSFTSFADGDHTFFHPTPLRSDDVKHPVIVWGNGTFLTPENYRGLLEHFASHGFIVVAANTTNTGSGNEMLAGLDKLATYHSTPGNFFQNKVDLTKVATMGHSQGGGGAINAARDPRVSTVIPIQPWLGTDTNLRGTVLFLSGTTDTVIPSASVRSRYDQAQSRLPVAYGDLAGADHFQPIGTGNSYRGLVTAWVRWQLMGDPIAAHQFVGQCAYCGNPMWSTYETNALLEATAPPPPSA